jgi:hypothetical protein
MSERTVDRNGEWRALTEAWAATDDAEGAEVATPHGALDSLRRRAERQRRRQIAVAVLEWLLFAGLLVLTVVVLRGGAAAWELIWLASLWGFTAVAMGFAWWNRRATWRAAGVALDDYVRLARLRAERQLRTVRFVLALFAVEVIVVVAQLAWFDRLVPAAVAALAAAAAVIVSWCVVTRRRLDRDLSRIDAFRRNAH